MRSSITITFLFALNFAQAQFQIRFNYNYALPLIRDEQCNSGIATRVNYINGNPALIYFAGVGDSYKNAALAAPDNSADRLRFELLGTAGMAVFSNKGYEFLDPNGKAFDSYGKSIAEINDGMGTGGFLTAGTVRNNSLTGANAIAGNGDALITKVSIGGVVSNPKRIDVNNGDDAATCIRKSAIPDPQGLPTWIMCGYSKQANHTECFVARVRENGTTVWLKRYNFDLTVAGGLSAHCIAKQVCEDAAGSIYVAGTFQDNQGGGATLGLAFKLNSVGAVQWAKSYSAGTDNEYEAIRLTADNKLIVSGFTNFAAMAPVTHNMIIAKLDPGNGAILFQNILQALANNGIAKFTSKSFDITQNAAQQYFLAGYIIRNGENVQMIYKTSPAGQPINWYVYNPMWNNVGFGIDNITTPNSLGIAYFSSMKNVNNNNFSDSHIMKTDYAGRTCLFCDAKPPLNIQINQEVHNHNQWLEAPAGDSHMLGSTTYNYSDLPVCNANDFHCDNAVMGNANMKSAVPAETKNNIAVSPNPVIDVLRVRLLSFPTGECQLTLTDLNGKIVQQRKTVYNYGSSVFNFDMSFLAPGLYFLTVRQGDLVLQEKVLKQ